MTSCFVMPPIHGGAFNRRYEEVFAPAIRAAGLEPYRVDRDPKVSVRFKISRTEFVRPSSVSLRSPSTTQTCGSSSGSPLLARRKSSSSALMSERPDSLDIQHRTILKYTTKSISDFERLRSEITAKVKAYLQKAETLANVSEITKLTTFEGLDHHQVVAIAALAENLQDPDDDASAFRSSAIWKRVALRNLPQR